MGSDNWEGFSGDPPVKWTAISSSDVTDGRPWLPITRTKDYTLIFPIDHQSNQVLLGLKKRGFAQGIWNGFGGKVEKGETIEQSVIRELHEESNLVAQSIIYRGQMLFNAQPVVQGEREGDGQDHTIRIHVYTVHSWKGIVEETEEMRPLWFPLPSPSSSVPTGHTSFAFPWDQMHHEAKIFLPPLLTHAQSQGDGTEFYGRADFFPTPSSSSQVKDLLEQKAEEVIPILRDWELGRWWFVQTL